MLRQCVSWYGESDGVWILEIGIENEELWMLHQTNFLHQMFFFRQLQQKIKTLIISQGIELICSDNVYRDTGNLMAFEF